MREKLLEYIVCPKCQVSFELSIAKQDEAYIMEGVLHCKNCNANYGFTENKLHNISITMKTNNSWRGKGKKVEA